MVIVIGIIVVLIIILISVLFLLSKSNEKVQIINCEPGYFKNETECVICPIGSYCPGDGDKYECQGDFIAPLTGFSTCACPTGFKPNGDICITCSSGELCTPQNMISNCPDFSSTTDHINCVCNTGYFKDGTECVICPTGYACPGNDNKYSCSSNTSLSDKSACLCPSGEYLSDTFPPNSCLECPANGICLGDNSYYTCPTNSVPNSAKTGCICISGMYMNAQGVCESCPQSNRRYCPGDNNYYTCPTNSEPNNAKTGCICIPGMYMDARGDCESCRSGKYCPGDNRYYQCPTNSTPNSAKTGCICIPGMYMNAQGFCESCPVNRYCPGNNIINNCPENSTTNSQERKTSILDCICADGKKLSGSDCVACSANRICTNNVESSCPGGLIPDPTQSFCTCGTGGVINATRDGCDICTAGTPNCYCDPRLYFDTVSGSCQPCNSGFYCPGNNLQMPCDNNRASTAQQLECNSCLPGYKRIDANLCVPCPTGSKCENGIENPCSFPYTTLLTGQRNCNDCSPGYYRNGETCQPCPANFYCPGNNIASPCPANTNSIEGQTGCVCNSDGYYTNTSGACVICPAGSYCRNGNRQNCPNNSSSEAGMSRCTCNPGSVRSGDNCELCQANRICLGGDHPGYYCRNRRASDPGSLVCHKCIPGYYITSTEPDGTANCTACPTGYKCTNGIDPEQCINNSTTLHDAEIVCNGCEPGYHYISENNCAECPAGNYCPGRITSPIPCPPNSIMDRTGFVSAANCSCPQDEILAENGECLTAANYLISNTGSRPKKYSMIADLYNSLRPYGGTWNFNCSNPNTMLSMTPQVQVVSRHLDDSPVPTRDLVRNFQGFFINKLELYPVTADRSDNHIDGSYRINIKYIYLIQNGRVVNNQFKLIYDTINVNTGLVAQTDLSNLFRNNIPLGTYQVQNGIYGDPNTLNDVNSIMISTRQEDNISRSLLIEAELGVEIRIDSIIIIFGNTNSQTIPNKSGYLSFKIGNIRIYNNSNYTSEGIDFGRFTVPYAIPTQPENKIFLMAEKLIGPLTPYCVASILLKNEYKNQDCFLSY